MPNKVIFREVEEVSGITLEEYLQMKDKKEQFKEADQEDSPRSLKKR